uniref:G_PROTEIN_RECEP_F1_2 domain-containing protein n=1 Tax=Macrostomum lignano TaxID=282301 RepID=A0A1I8GA28_9PLAT
MGRGGGGGGRIRFRASKSGHAPESPDELDRRLRNSTSKFAAINSGCFYKSDGMFCPERLTDYYCVMWTRGLQLEDEELAVAGGQLRGVGNATTTQPPTWAVVAEQQLQAADICAGDFIDESILQANCALPLILVLVGTLLNLLNARVAIGYCDRQLPVCFYLVVLSAVDTIILYYRQLDLWLQSVFDMRLTLSLMMMDESACQLMNMLYSILYHFKAMLQIAMAVDARRLVVRPLRCVERYSAEWVKNSLILMCVILVLINGHHLWTLALVKESSSGEFDRVYHCGWGATWPVTELFTTWLWPLTDLLIGDLAPLFVVLWAASSGYRHLWRCSRFGRRRRNVDTNSDGCLQYTCSKSLDYHIIDRRLFRSVSQSLLACSLTYAALQSPSAVHSCIMYVRFLSASLAAQASGARDLGQFYRPTNDEWRLFIGRLCSAVQPLTNCLLLLLCVPNYRHDAARLLNPGRLRWTKCLRRCQRATADGDARAENISNNPTIVGKFPAAVNVMSVNRKQRTLLTAV